MAPVPVDSPLRRSIQLINNILINDDDAERRRRRSLLISENIEENANLKMCLKLYADNKITQANAWSVPVIDTFIKMIEKHHEVLQNFQIAGSTLEASSKVYGLRVDSVHTDVKRMCSELVRSNLSPLAATQSTRNQANDSTADNRNNVNQQPPENQPRRPNRRRASTITQNKATINGKLATNPIMDPCFAKLNSVVGDINSSNRLMQTFVPTKNSVLQLKMMYPCWDANETTDPCIEEPLNLMEDHMPISMISFMPVLTPQNLLHSTLASYVQSDLSAHSSSNEDNEDLHYDINAEVEPIQEIPSVIIDHNNFDDELTEQDQIAVNKCAGLRRTPTTIDDMRPMNSASSSLEYTYRPMDMINRFWAGPSHWKFQKFCNTSQVLQPTAARASRRKKSVLKKITVNDFLQNVDALFKKIDFNAPLPVAVRKRYTRWEANGKINKLPTNLRLDAHRFDRYRYAPGLQVKNWSGETDANEIEHSDDGNNDSIINSVYINDALNESVMNETVFNIPTEFEGAPDIIKKINIPYAKTAKNVDMKQLKATCWRIIEEKADDRDAPSCSWQIPTTKPVSFNEVVEELPRKLSKRMADNVSKALAFYSILHLVNEKNLELVHSLEDLDDFKIKIPKK